ncbi:hypothetical protein Q5O14_11530 [Eubacteriaceae bacterium ES2]|nr:hypothetical protein Q5O14_11530 [Eubacteriaceae bacterium ES2]
MLTIEEYIARRKKEDKLNEFYLKARTQNMKICAADSNLRGLEN